MAEGTKKGFVTSMSALDRFGEGVETVEKPFGKALIEAAKTRPEILGLTADLAKYTDLDVFAETYPDRFFNIGMAEQNLMGVASGLARTGFVPFATTYCSFAGRRAFDFIVIAVAEGKANVKIIAALPGLTTGYGATHQGTDDLALMRAVPDLMVIDPADATEIEQAVPAIADHPGPVYMRILRGRVKRTFDPKSYRFEIGKARRLRSGKGVVLICTGMMADRTLEAAEELNQNGIAAGVLHVSTIKPLDGKAILEAAEETRAVVTVENHTLLGGLASAVAEEIVASGLSVSFARIGVPDKFIEPGSVPYLHDKYGLSTRHIVKAARDVAGRLKK